MILRIQEVEDARGALSLVGTPDYSAPEVLKTGVYRWVASIDSMYNYI